jgi:hypothetical protein
VAEADLDKRLHRLLPHRRALEELGHGAPHPVGRHTLLQNPRSRGRDEPLKHG